MKHWHAPISRVVLAAMSLTVAGLWRGKAGGDHSRRGGAGERDIGAVWTRLRRMRWR